MVILDVDFIFAKGMSKEIHTLSVDEWKIFIVTFFGYITVAEGWDHFYNYHMAWYPSLTNTLKQIGDRKSL